jgi:hypothetical protein
MRTAYGPIDPIPLQNHLGDDSFPFKGSLYLRYRYQSQDASPVNPTAIAITSPLSTGSLFHHPVPLSAAKAQSSIRFPCLAI